MRKLVPLFAICLLTAACTSAGATGSAGPGASGTPGSTTPPKYAVETAPDKLILRIATAGGFIAPGYLLTSMPQFALYGDGRLIVPGPVVEIYPGPLLPNLLVMRVTPAEIQTILAAADKAGLLGPNASYLATGIADAGTTVFTTKVGGATHTISAYALMADAKADNVADDAARARLLEFENQISNLNAFLGRQVSDAESYAPTGMLVFARLADAPDPTAPAQQIVAWPLSLDPATVGQPTTVPQTSCIPLSGTDLATFLTVARTANAMSLWTYGTVRYAVSVRPLYPDESSCPSSAI